MQSIVKQNLLYFLIGIISFSLILLRAVYLPPYGDEINTFFIYVKSGRFQPFYAHLDANNHVINSLFTHLFYLIFGSKPIVLRLPNVLSFLIYLIYNWKLAKLLKTKYLGYLWFIVMITPMYLISFFSLSRGYGMSMAFLMASCYYIVIYEAKSKSQFLFAGLLMNSLALWANLSLMIPVLIIGAIFIFLFIKKSALKISSQLIINSAIIIIVFIIPLIYAILYLFDLKKSGALYLGVSEGSFYSAMLNFIIQFLEFNKIVVLIFKITFLLFVITSVFNLFNFKKISKLTFFPFLFWGTIIGTITMHLALGINYQHDRAALHFFVLFVLAFYFSLDNLKLEYLKYLGFIPAIALCTQFFVNINLSYVPFWKNESIPTSISDFLIKESNKSNCLPTISSQFFLGMNLEYIAYSNNEIMNCTHEKNFPSKISDYIIANSWWENNISLDYDTLIFDSTTKTVLLKRKRKFEWQYVETYKETRRKLSDQYYTFLEMEPKSNYIDKPFSYDISFNLSSKKIPVDCKVVCSIYDSLSKTLLFEEIDLFRVNPNVKESNFFHKRQYLESIPVNAKKIKFFFWNIYNNEIEVSNLEIKIYTGS